MTSSVPDEVQGRDEHHIEIIGNDRDGYRARCLCGGWQDQDGCKNCLEALADRHIREAS